MCWVLYLAADRPLPLQPFDQRAPAFNVAELTSHEDGVRQQFSKPFVYSLGAHTHCGCGFDRGQANPDLELFACWDGDQGAGPDHRWTRRVADFGSRMDWFPDRTFIEVKPS
jgi:hypothetical protein